MCILAWDWRPQDPVQPLLLLGNRDEFYARATRGLHHWEDAPILGGRDLEAGGTWLGVTPTRRMAALTNVRNGQPQNPQAPSRGHLVQDFLTSTASSGAYLHGLLDLLQAYNPFNLLVWDGDVLLLLESRHGRIHALPAGVGSVSNGDLDTPWPKTARLREALARQCKPPGGLGAVDGAALLALLQDRWQPTDALLPATGVPLEWERLLAPIFVESPSYGTRCSSVLRLGPGGARFVTRERDEHGSWSQQQLELPWQA
ncbi:MAG: NRDE family protein [Rhodoferax sp.]